MLVVVQHCHKKNRKLAICPELVSAEVVLSLVWRPLPYKGGMEWRYYKAFCLEGWLLGHLVSFSSDGPCDTQSPSKMTGKKHLPEDEWPTSRRKLEQAPKETASPPLRSLRGPNPGNEFIKLDSKVV